MQRTVTINGQVITAEESFLVTLINGSAAPAAPAKSRKATPAKAKAPKRETPAWLIQAAKNRDARGALAAAMRANGEDPHGDLWYARKAEAGIK